MSAEFIETFEEKVLKTQNLAKETLEFVQQVKDYIESLENDGEKDSELEERIETLSSNLRDANSEIEELEEGLNGEKMVYILSSILNEKPDAELRETIQILVELLKSNEQIKHPLPLEMLLLKLDAKSAAITEFSPNS